MNHPTMKATPRSRSRRLPGFTLIEILTVIAIITILMAAGAIGIGNLNAGKGVTSAVATCESLFEEARTIAVSKRTNTRVMVDINDKASENYLRRIIIAYENVILNPDGSVASRSWVQANRGYEMPKGTYFSAEYSALEGGGRIKEETLGGTDIKADYHGKYVYYEFNGEGIFEDAGSSFVVGAGVRPKGQEPKTTKGAARDFAGFVVWRNGRTSNYRNPEQIPSLPSGDQPFNF
jgi:prepilin-type N-terminal cleavage/methylation domain-containing protein